MIRWIKRYFQRRDVERRLIAYAKTTEGRVFLEAAYNNNLILADYYAEVLDAEPIHYTIRTRLPTATWRIINKP